MMFASERDHEKNRDYQRRADAQVTRLQRIVLQIRAEYPSAAAEVDNASRLLGILAGRLPTGGSDADPTQD